MKISLLKLRNESKDYFDAHDQVKSFFWGDFLRHYADNQIKHAVIVASPMRASNISRKSVQVQLLVTYASRVFSDFSNLDEVHSDALDVLTDFVGALNNAPRWKDFVSGATSGNAEFFFQRTGDLVAGAAMFITLTIKNTVDLCAQPVSDYDFDLSPQPPQCLPATIVNSDGEFSVNVPSGSTYELPDTPVLVTDLVGNPLGSGDVPSVTGGTIEIEITPTPCAPVTYNVEFANGDPIESGSEPSGGNIEVIVPNCPVSPNTGIYKSGQTILVLPSDAVRNLEGMGADWWNLDPAPQNENIFGHHKRFTGTAGGYQSEIDDLFYDKDGNTVANFDAAFPLGIIVDWKSRDFQYNKVLAYGVSNINFGATRLALDTEFEALTIGSYSNWKLPNSDELISIINKGLVNRTDYVPFSNVVSIETNFWARDSSDALTGSRVNFGTGGGVWLQNRSLTENFRGLPVSYLIISGPNLI